MGYADGLFSGFSGVMSMYNQYQGVQDSKAVRSAATEQSNFSGVEDTVQGLRDQNGPSDPNTVTQAPSSPSSSGPSLQLPAPRQIANADTARPSGSSGSALPAGYQDGAAQSMGAPGSPPPPPSAMQAPGAVAPDTGTTSSYQASGPAPSPIGARAGQPAYGSNPEGNPLPQQGPMIWTAGQGVHRAAVGESGIGYTTANGLRPTAPYDGKPPVAPSSYPPDQAVAPGSSPFKTKRGGDVGQRANAQALPTAPAPQPMITQDQVPGLGGPQPPETPQQTSSLGSSILSAVMPSAQAGELTPAQRDQAQTPPATLGETKEHTVLTSSERAPFVPPPAAGAEQRQPTQGINTAPETRDLAAGPAAVTTTQTITPGQQGPTLASEPTPVGVHLSPKPYLALQQSKDPDAATHLATINQVADKYGVSPWRIALTWHQESAMHDAAPTNPESGARGSLQITPVAQKEVDPQGKLDPEDLRDAFELSARIIKKNDDIFGKDTVTSQGAYFSGADNMRKLIANPNLADGAPKTMKYMRDAQGGAVDLRAVPAPSNIDPVAFQQEATKGGPDAALTYLVSAGGRGQPMSELWRNAEVQLMSHAAQHGDYAGMQHARDFVFQMVHAGTSEHLQDAYISLQSGDTMGAAQALAKAHAFAPDNSSAKFAVDGQGQLVGQRFSEIDPTKPMGAPVPISLNTIAGLLSRAADPHQFMASVQHQQLLSSEIALHHAQIKHFGDEIDVQREGHAVTLAGHQQTSLDRGDATRARLQASEEATLARRDIAAERGQYYQSVQQARLDSAKQLQDERLEARRQLQAEHQHSANAALEKETNTAFDPSNMPKGMDPGKFSLGSTLYKDIRSNDPGSTGPYSKYLADGLIGGTFKIAPVTDGSGRWGIAGQDGVTLGTLSGPTGQQFNRMTRGSAIGGGVGMPAGALPTNNPRAGTSASSAVP